MSVDLDPEDERLLEDDMGAPSDAKRFVPLTTGPYAGFSEGGFEMEKKVTKN